MKALPLPRPQNSGEKQTGINMVDLMMWLVVAALLLAAAIQGIGYYQQNARVYQMRESVDVATSRVIALAANDGVVTIDKVDSVVADMNASSTNGIILSASAIDVTAAVEPGANQYGFELSSVVTSTTVGSGQTFYVRASNPNVAGYDVIHTFGDIASKKSGTYLVNKGTTDPATPGGAPAPSASATSTATATSTSTASASATPTPTPTPTRPADVNATGVTITQNGGYPAYWPDESVASDAAGYPVNFGFSLTQVNSAAAAANYTVVWSGGGNVNAASYVQGNQQGNGYMWTGTVYSGAGGFTAGTGYITATVTEKATGNVSTKTWVLTVTPQPGPIQGSWHIHDNDWVDKSAPNSVSGASAQFGFRIPFAKATDYTVTYSGGANIGAVTGGAISTYTDDNGGTDWAFRVSAPAGGFTTGTGVITATVKHNLTGQTWTKTYNLTITDNAGPVAGGYYSDYWTDKVVSVGTSSGKVDGFSMPYASQSDFTVVFTSTGNINETLSATQFNGGADYPNAYYYTIVSAKAGGYTAGVSTVTATITSKSSGKVFTKTWKVTSS